MSERTQVLQLPALRRLAQAQAVDKEAGTFEVVWAAGAQVRRYDFWRDESWIEELDMSEGAVDMSRLNAGAPLLDSHQRMELRNVIGVTEKAWLDNGQGVARLRFSNRAEVAPIRQDVEDKILRNVSVGYEVLELKEVGRDKESGLRRMRATRWAPFELSLVPVNADAGAQVRGQEQDDTQRLSRCLVTLSQPAAPAATHRSMGMDNTQQAPTAGNNAAPQAPQPQPSGEELERARVRQLVDLGEQYAKYVGSREINDAIRNGRSPEQFKEVIMQAMQTRHTDTSGLRIGMTGAEVQRYSLSRAILASLTGDWSKAGFERECSRAVEKLLGATPEGFFVPFDAWQRRDFNVGTAAEAGNLVATDLRTDLYVDALRNAMVLARMGIRILPGLTSTIDLPRKATPSTLGMLTEIGSAAETNPATAKVTLSPKRVGAYVEYSKQALIQSSMALEPLIRDDLITGAAVLIEYQALNGAGTGAEMRGIRNTTGIGTVVGGTNGAAPTWAHVVDLESAVANANAEPDRLAGYLVNTRLRGKAKQTTKATNLGFMWDNGEFPLNGYRAGVTNNLPSNLTKGTSTTIASAGIFASDYSMGVLGFFGAPDVTVDPYTKADTGQVKITLNQFADFGVRQPAAFAKIDDWLAN